MAFHFDPGALLGRFYPLADGSRVHLRVARSSDAAAIRELFARQEDSARAATPDFEAARLVNFNPRERCVLTASALIDGAERMVGMGSIELGGDPHSDPEPELVVVDPDAPVDLAALLTGALVGRAGLLARDRAA